MRSKKETSPESIVREIKRKTRRKFSAEEKIRIILEGLRGEKSITDLCRKEGIVGGRTGQLLSKSPMWSPGRNKLSLKIQAGKARSQRSQSAQGI